MATSSWTSRRTFRGRGPAEQSGQIVADIAGLLDDLVNLVVLLIVVLDGGEEEHDAGNPARHEEGPAAPETDRQFQANPAPPDRVQAGDPAPADGLKLLAEPIGRTISPSHFRASAMARRIRSRTSASVLAPRHST